MRELNTEVDHRHAEPIRVGRRHGVIIRLDTLRNKSSTREGLSRGEIGKNEKGGLRGDGEGEGKAEGGRLQIRRRRRGSCDVALRCDSCLTLVSNHHGASSCTHFHCSSRWPSALIVRIPSIHIVTPTVEENPSV